MDSSVRHRIDLLRFVMIFGVVVLHTPKYVPIAEVGADLFSLIKAFFQNAMFRTTVPVLTFISGYLIFHSGLDQLPKLLAAKKSRSLLVPFLAFNLPLVVAVWLAELLTSVRTNYRLVPFDPAVWQDAAFGILHSPINYPLNFLRDMLVLMCLAPLMGYLIRRAAVLGFALVCLFFLNNFDGILILRDVMPVIFYAGGVAAYRKWDLRALDRYAVPCAILILLLCAAIVHFRIANTNLLRLVSPLLIWPASSLLLNTRFGNWCGRMNKYSFFLFVAHAPLLFATWLVYQRFGQGLPYPVYWVLAPVLTTAMIVALYRCAARFVPGPFALMIGGRNKKGATPENPASADGKFLRAGAQDRIHEVKPSADRLPRTIDELKELTR
jgi:succinoglycan biosynthesis protein ExoH